MPKMIKTLKKKLLIKFSTQRKVENPILIIFFFASFLIFKSLGGCTHINQTKSKKKKSRVNNNFEKKKDIYIFI